MFRYPFMTRYANAIYFLLCFSLGLGASVYAYLYGAPGYLQGLAIIWSLILVLMLLSGFAANRDRKIYSSVSIDSEGIRAHRVLPTSTSKPADSSSFHKWETLKQIEHFRFPDLDAVLGRGKSGIRLLVGNEKIIIWEQIQQYKDLVDLLERNVQEKAR